MGIRFSQWYGWSDRAAIPHVRKPGGVYIIGKHVRVGSAANPYSPRVIYIGLTSKPLLERLNAFDRSSRSRTPSGKGRGHAGGNRYFDLYGTADTDQFRVAIWHPTSRWKRNYRRLPKSKRLAFAEAKLQVEYVRRNRRLPTLNKGFG